MEILNVYAQPNQNSPKSESLRLHTLPRPGLKLSDCDVELYCDYWLG